jgi:hypothetical protein
MLEAEATRPTPLAAETPAMVNSGLKGGRKEEVMRFALYASLESCGLPRRSRIGTACQWMNI